MPRPGSTVARGYGAEHVALRAKLKPQVDAGLVACWRCGHMIEIGEPWDLGHDDIDRSIYRGPEHRGRCNRRAGARKGNQARGRRRALAKLTGPTTPPIEYTDTDW